MNNQLKDTGPYLYKFLAEEFLQNKLLRINGHTFLFSQLPNIIDITTLKLLDHLHNSM